MVRLQIEIDEETNRRLTELASEYDGNLGLALADLVRVRDRLEDFAERSETANAKGLLAMRDSAEEEFRQNRTIPWDEVKLRNGL